MRLVWVERPALAADDEIRRRRKDQRMSIPNWWGCLGREAEMH
jgi:hypothetical protein